MEVDKEVVKIPYLSGAIKGLRLGAFDVQVAVGCRGSKVGVPAQGEGIPIEIPPLIMLAGGRRPCVATTLTSCRWASSGGGFPAIERRMSSGLWRGVG